MRPLTLVVQGIRSYRDRHEIDFTGKGLVAIVGKTGAGKSSLLEGIFFALFGGSTWDMRSAAALIADGEPSMRVELTFTCQGKTWQVRRALFRSTTPARHELTCLDDPTIRFDSKGSVDRQIEHLVGLNPKTFLKTILLPQGRFQALLYANDSERTPILKTLLGLDLLDSIAQQAADAYRRLEPELGRLRAARGRLLDDPDGRAAELTTRLGEASARHQTLVATNKQISTLDERVRTQRRRAQESARGADHLAALRRPDAPDLFRQLIAGRDKHLQLIDDQHRVAQRAECHRDHVEAFILEADRAGVGLARSAEVAETLRSGKRRLADLKERERDLEQRTRDLATDEAGLPDLESRRRADADHAKSAHDEHDAAVAAHREAVIALATARAALADVRADRDAAAQFTTAEKEKVSLAAKALEDADRAGERAEQARLAALGADADHEAAIRANAAAHVAATCAPGEPCPVCQQPVPATFSVPTPPDESTTAGARTTARKRSAATAAKHTELRTRAGTLGEELAALREAERAASPGRTARAEDLARVLGQYDLGWDDAVILANQNRAVAHTQQREVETRQAEISTSVTAKTTAAAVTALHTQLKKTHAKLGTDAEKLRDAWIQLRADLTDVHFDGDLTGTLSNNLFDEYIAAAVAHQAAAASLAEEFADAQNAVHHQRLELEKLHAVIATDVATPAEALTAALAALATALGGANIEFVNQGDLEMPDSLDAKPGWAQTMDEHVERAVLAAQRAAKEATESADEAQKTEANLLATVGAANLEALTEITGGALADVKVLERDLTETRRQIPIAADLSRRIDTLQPLVDALDDVGALMTNGNFPAAAIEQRQVRFLELATERLLDMTDRRFGFADDFRIVDALTSQARDAKTLSGGETFLASLALALAVVDLAGRAGGRVDAFFLDEGFGSLDQDALNQALDTLAQQTLGGRLIAVISHMAAVVEEIDDVLLVGCTHKGSTATWASAEDRKRLAEADYQDLLG